MRFGGEGDKPGQSTRDPTAGGIRRALPALVSTVAFPLFFSNSPQRKWAGATRHGSAEGDLGVFVAAVRMLMGCKSGDGRLQICRRGAHDRNPVLKNDWGAGRFRRKLKRRGLVYFLTRERKNRQEIGIDYDDRQSI